MVFKYVPDRKGIGDASFQAILDEKMRGVAEQILTNAQRIAQAATFEDYGPHVEQMYAFGDSLRIVELQRPKGRGDLRVETDSIDAESVEWGDTNTERQRILGRAAGIEIFPDE